MQTFAIRKEYVVTVCVYIDGICFERFYFRMCSVQVESGDLRAEIYGYTVMLCYTLRYNVKRSLECWQSGSSEYKYIIIKIY